MKIQQLINCQQKNHLNKIEVGNIKNENKEVNDVINEDVDMEELHEQFHKNIFLPPLGSPSPTEISSNQQQPQPKSAKSPSSINNENIHLNNFDNLQKFFFQPNISYNSLAQSNLTQALMLLQQNNYNNNQISPNFRPIVTPTLNPTLPTAENFLHFIQLAHAFGFKFDFNQKILSYTPPTNSLNSFDCNLTTKTNNNEEQQVPQIVSAKYKRKCPATSLTSTASIGNGPQHQRMESSQSRHCNNSSAINANECGGGLENVNEQQKLQTISPILLNFPPTQQMTSAAMRDYLANPGRYECAMWIFHAKVAQKSYGNEKRFFCPPPCVYLLGEGWRNRRKALDQIFKRIKEQNEKNSSDFLSNGDSCHEMFSEIISTIGINQPQNTAERLSCHHIAHPLDFTNGKDYCAAKALFISDTDKRKYFYLHTTFSHACGGIDIGTFSSQRIKVISKPSKKKQSMKSSDCKYLCVSNGSKIALFNRLRSQTVSTRYLHVENGCFHASSTKWGAFHINSDNPQPFTTNNSNNNQTSTIITYGSVIQLIDAQSNIALPKLRIRKVDKQMVLLDPSSQGEPVSQLHKCAFQMVDTSGGGVVVAGQESLYLCLSHDKIIQHQAVRIDPNRHQISDGAAWTIISTDKSEYRWAEPLANIGSFARLPITPMPQLHNLNISSLNTETNNGIKSEIPTNIELNGSNFSPSIRVWIGATPTETIFCSSERLNCSIPFLNLICSDLGFNTETAILANSNNGNEKLDVPILLVREEDSVVFPTSLSFTYSLTGQPFTTSGNTKKQQSGKDNNLLINLETSSNKINNLNRFHPYWNTNSENNGDSTSVNN